MNYIFYSLIAILVLFLLNKLLGFVFKVLFFLIIVGTAIVLYKSTKSPVELFGKYKVDNLMVTQIK